MSEKTKKGLAIEKEVESTSEELTLEEYVEKAKPHAGLVASFKVENASEGLKPRSIDEWARAFEDQSNKVYK